jgi:hypothetical protein
VAERKRYWSVQTSEPGPPSPANPAFAAQERGEETFTWPAEPDLFVRLSGVSDAPYVVDVELVRDDEGELVPVGVSVRRTFSTSRHKQRGRYVFAPGERPVALAAVDVRQIPFGRAIRAAITAASSPQPSDDRSEELDRILVPRGRPRRGKSVKFYCDLLKAARSYEEAGLSPAKEIARRKEGVSPNLVHQWLHVARRYERLGMCNG